MCGKQLIRLSYRIISETLAKIKDLLIQTRPPSLPGSLLREYTLPLLSAALCTRRPRRFAVGSATQVAFCFPLATWDARFVCSLPGLGRSGGFHNQ